MVHSKLARVFLTGSVDLAKVTMAHTFEVLAAFSALKTKK